MTAEPKEGAHPLAPADPEAGDPPTAKRWDPPPSEPADGDASAEPCFAVVLNGRSETVTGVAPATSLLTWLRATGRTGTKEGCAEGDCGACTVALVDVDHRGRRTYRAVNSCLVLMPMVAGREVVTVEGVAEPEPDGAMHPVQQAMCDRYGSQCGYCTPGFVMSMIEAYYREDITPADARTAVVDQLTGNLCRCTGYRPIRDAAMAALAARDGSPDRLQRALASSPAARTPLVYAAGGHSFLRPTSLAELLELTARYGEEATLVAGATEIGVVINKTQTRHPLLISTEGVAELAMISGLPDRWRIGGAATLTAIEDALAAEYPLLGRMLRVFASRQIRNRATLAGNLVTAAPIGDLAPVLLALDADVVLVSSAGERTVALADFFVAYRRTALRPGEVVRWVEVPRGAPDGVVRRADSVKVAKRRDLATSVAAAAFVVDTRDGLVTRARLAYGGVAATPVRAVRAEETLLGRAWDEDAWTATSEVLSTELAPIGDHRGGEAYRRQLVTGMFEAFARGGSGAALEAPADFEPTQAWPRDGAGRGLDHESARGHVTGDARYVDDVARRRTMLDVWPVASPHGHARVLSIDTSAALAEPGVVSVLTARDVPGLNDTGPIRQDEPLFAQEEAQYAGHLVALVVAEDLQACRRGAAKVVVEYEPLPAVVGIRAALAAGSFHTEPHDIRRGDCGAALASSPHVLEGELDIGGQEHFSLESHAAWAEVGEGGEVFVNSSTQHPSEVQATVAHVLDLPRHSVVVESPRMGGGFGGKETQAAAWAALVALASLRTGRPVRVQLDRDVDMIMTGKRHPFLARYRVGYDDEGRLLAMQVRLWSDGGWSLDLSQSILDRAMFHLDNCYYVPSVDLSGTVARTNTASNTAFRGFGGPQGMLVVEDVLARVAMRLGLPAEEVRERNLYRGTGATSTTHYGQELGEERIVDMWAALTESTGLADRRRAVERFNADHPHVKRGLAMTPVKFGISFTAAFMNQAGALVLVYVDGTVQVNHGGTEMGQGLYTKIRGIAMRELGLTEQQVKVMRTRTDKVPNTSATAASSGSDLNGQAVLHACTTLRERLAPVAARLLEEAGLPVGVPAAAVVFADGGVHAPQAPDVVVPFVEVVERAYIEQIPLSATGFYATPGIGYDRRAGRGRPFHYFAYGVALSEVEVDGFTGMKRVVAVDILHDVGTTLNAGVDRGQVEGGFVQGMGWLTGEELLHDADGVLLTHAAGTYQIPAIGDTPERFDVTLLPHAPQDGVVHGSKAVGEPPLMLAISVREAIRHAIAAFGEPGGEVVLPSPVTHEVTLGAILDRTTVAGDPPA